jgi:hypothetical protein
VGTGGMSNSTWGFADCEGKDCHWGLHNDYEVNLNLNFDASFHRLELSFGILGHAIDVFV